MISSQEAIQGNEYVLLIDNKGERRILSLKENKLFLFVKRNIILSLHQEMSTGEKRKLP